jgi:N-acetylglucosaminyldiphosphoundecaprenol N-acetyl-beta-D-mannosaminyltransferase
MLTQTARVPFLGYAVNSLTMREAVEWVENAVQAPHLNHVVVINANKMWLADRNPPLRNILCHADLVIPEYAVVWGCKVLGTPVRGHIGGIMLLKELLPRLESQPTTVYFLGARDTILTGMLERLRIQYPGLKVAGSHSGYFAVDQEPSIVQSINDSGAQILFVALGSPRQEIWIEKNRANLKVRVAMGLGGSFDVLAGAKKDAPPWVRHGWEWLYRLAQDPRNLWKRYMTTNPWFVAQVMREKFMPCKISKTQQSS